VVWSCRPPIEGLSESEDCQEQWVDWEKLQEYLAQDPPQANPELYVVMDSLTYNEDLTCIEDDPPGTVRCDFDDPPDGEADFMASGGRSWADLDGSQAGNDCGGSGEGASELVSWINGGYPCDLPTHVWMPHETGNMNSVFAAVYDKWWPVRATGLLVVIPVFDDWCKDGYPASCGSTVHEEDSFNYGSSNQSHFHIIDFAAFVITCVRLTGHQPPNAEFPDSCPGYARFAELNGPGSANPIFNNGQINNMNTIEGYFVTGVPEGLGGKCEGGIDTGAYTLYLDY
jgi:hypothetical protein